MSIWARFFQYFARFTLSLTLGVITNSGYTLEQTRTRQNTLHRLEQTRAFYNIEQAKASY